MLWEAAVQGIWRFDHYLLPFSGFSGPFRASLHYTNSVSPIMQTSSFPSVEKSGLITVSHQLISSPASVSSAIKWGMLAGEGLSEHVCAHVCPYVCLRSSILPPSLLPALWTVLSVFLSIFHCFSAALEFLTCCFLFLDPLLWACLTLL